MSKWLSIDGIRKRRRHWNCGRHWDRHNMYLRSNDNNPMDHTLRNLNVLFEECR